MISAFDTTAKVDAAFAELKAYWDRLLDIYVVKTDEEKLDRMVNIWNQYQCMITFNMSRSASFFERGKGLPRLQPGPRGLRASDTGTSPRTNHRHSFYPIPRRRMLPPIPTADQTRQQRHRRRLQR